MPVSISRCRLARKLKSREKLEEKLLDHTRKTNLHEQLMNETSPAKSNEGHVTLGSAVN